MEELYLKNRDQVKKFIAWRLSQEKEVEEPEEENPEDELYVFNEAVELLAEKFEVY